MMDYVRETLDWVVRVVALLAVVLLVVPNVITARAAGYWWASAEDDFRAAYQEARAREASEQHDGDENAFVYKDGKLVLEASTCR